MRDCDDDDDDDDDDESYGPLLYVQVAGFVYIQLRANPPSLPPHQLF
jgi:hypothetical protein